MAGLIIIPACFAFNVEPGAGPGLVFITLPNVFNQMAGGRLWGALFFLFMSFAAPVSYTHLQMKSKILVMKIPLLWEIKEFPFTAALFASVVVSIHVFPSTAYLWGVPDHLWRCV